MANLIAIDPENLQQFFERDFETSRETKKFVNAGDRAGFDIGKGGVSNVKVSVALDVGNRTTDAFDVTGLNKTLVAQFPDPFTRVHVSGRDFPSQPVFAAS